MWWVKTNRNFFAFGPFDTREEAEEHLKGFFYPEEIEKRIAWLEYEEVPRTTPDADALTRLDNACEKIRQVLRSSPQVRRAKD